MLLSEFQSLAAAEIQYSVAEHFVHEIKAAKARAVTGVDLFRARQLDRARLRRDVIRGTVERLGVAAREVETTDHREYRNIVPAPLNGLEKIRGNPSAFRFFGKMTAKLSSEKSNGCGFFSSSDIAK